MARRELTSVDEVEREGSWLFTVEDTYGELDEAIVVECSTGDVPVAAWINRCMHEDQRLHRAGVGAIIRDGEIVCPRHGSLFDTCTGACDNGEAAGTTLIDLAIEIEHDSIYLVDERYTYVETGPLDDGDDRPSSTSHIQF